MARKRWPTTGPREVLRNAGIGVVAMLPAAGIALLMGNIGFSDTILPAAAMPAPFPLDATETSTPSPSTVVDDTVVTITAPRNAVAPVSVEDAALNGAKAAAHAGDIPDVALAAYHRAATVINATDESCHMPWELLAALGRVESDHGRFGGSSLDADGVATPAIFGLRLDGTHDTSRIRDTDAGDYDGDTRFDRAVGPMQFIPSTWSYVGVDADGDGERNPQDIQDAALGAAVYLCVGKEDLSTDEGQRRAVYRYNHSHDYVDLVLSIEKSYASGAMWEVPGGTPTTTTISVVTTGGSDPDETDTPMLPQAEELASMVAIIPFTNPPPPTQPPSPSPSPSEPADNEPTDDPSTPTDPDPTEPPSTDPSPEASPNEDPGTPDPSPSPTADPGAPAEPTADPPAGPAIDTAAIRALPNQVVDAATALCSDLGFAGPAPLETCVWVAVEPITTDPNAALPSLDELRARLDDVQIPLP